MMSPWIFLLICQHQTDEWGFTSSPTSQGDFQEPEISAGWDQPHHWNGLLHLWNAFGPVVGAIAMFCYWKSLYIAAVLLLFGI